jgi:uncharacterized protein YciI
MRFGLLMIAYCVMASAALAQSSDYIFVFLHKRTDIAELPEEQLKKIMDGHMANIERLAKEGKLVAAGPFDSGGGIFIFRSNSVAEVTTWLQTDPGEQAQRWRIEMLPYTPRSGSVCPAPEPYEMVSYQFIRFIPFTAKDNIAWQPKLLQQHEEFLLQFRQSGNVITEGSFGEKDGGIMILREAAAPATLANDPAVSNGLLETDLKTLWIAKGSFCEK